MEYKFRGFDAVGDKGWVYGDLVHNQKVTKDGLEPRVMVGGYEVVPDSVGLFTGMTDKNGKEIYEGDIIRFVNGQKKVSGELVDNEFIYTIEYSEGAFHGVLGLSKVLDAVEVIGNIYDNTELLSTK